MSYVWNNLGQSGAFRHYKALAAYLGDEPSIKKLKNMGIIKPTKEHFIKDPIYNVNIHKLNFSEEHLQTLFLVRTIAAWGKEAMIRSSLACAELQLIHQKNVSDKFLILQKLIVKSIKKGLSYDPFKRNKELESATLKCRKLYKPYEDKPYHHREANQIYYCLGAFWCAAEASLTDYELQDYDTGESEVTSSTWMTRNSVWPQRAAESAAHWSSEQMVQNQIKSKLIAWASTA